MTKVYKCAKLWFWSVGTVQKITNFCRNTELVWFLLLLLLAFFWFILFLFFLVWPHNMPAKFTDSTRAFVRLFFCCISWLTWLPTWSSEQQVTACRGTGHCVLQGRGGWVSVWLFLWRWLNSVTTPWDWNLVVLLLLDIISHLETRECHWIQWEYSQGQQNLAHIGAVLINGEYVTIACFQAEQMANFPLSF